MLDSTIKYSKSGSSDIASKMRHQTPLMLYRLKRRNTLFQSPGRACTHNPKHAFHEHRVITPVEPFWSSRPIISGAIRSHAASLKTNRSFTPKTASPKAGLNLICS
jgi:hypothetical protein